MRLLPGCCLLFASACASAQQAASPPPAPAAVKMSAAECEVWARERSFAASVEGHDPDAFRAHIHPDAAFIESRTQVVRGREAIAESWAGIIKGEEIVLRWHPGTVTIAGDIASSRGPYWILNPRLEQEPRYLIGQFSSIWVQGGDGRWLVMFDGVGDNQPRPATEADVDALKATLRATCP